MMIDLFVYGSLKQGGRANHMLYGHCYVGKKSTVFADYELRQVDWFPAMIAGDYIVEGEHYQIGEELLPILDAYESTMFKRVEIPIGPSNDIVYAITYMWDDYLLPPANGIVTNHDTQEWKI